MVNSVVLKVLIKFAVGGKKLFCVLLRPWDWGPSVFHREVSWAIPSFSFRSPCGNLNRNILVTTTAVDSLL